MDSILSQINAISNFTSCSLKTYFNIIPIIIITANDMQIFFYFLNKNNVSSADFDAKKCLDLLCTF
jgi:hypothetical protein